MADLQCAKCKSWKGIRDFRCQSVRNGAFEFSPDCHECENPLDFDCYYMGRDDLIQEVMKLRAGIRNTGYVPPRPGAWRVPELWNLLPEKVDPQPEIPPEEEFLAACKLYRKSLDKP